MPKNSMALLGTNRTVQKVKGSTMYFSVGAAMFVTTIFMTAVAGLYGAVLAAGITGASFALGINARSKEKRV